MSVLKNKRDRAPTEHTRAFMDLYNYSVDRMERVAKRKRPYICEKLNLQLSILFDMIIQTENDFFHYQLHEYQVDEQAKMIINQLVLLQKPLLVFWNIEKSPTQTMAYWIKLIGNTINEMTIYGGLEGLEKLMFILDRKSIENLEAMKNMCRFHAFIYQKIISAPSYVRETRGKLLMDLADEALYRLALANRKIPTTKKESELRRRNIEICFKCISEMNRPIMSLYNLLEYSENTMYKWGSFLDRQESLLNGLLKSDAERFADLQ